MKYNFAKKWSSSDSLKYKFFLSGFSLSSNSNLVKIFHTKTDITPSGIYLTYTTKGTQTKIGMLKVDVIIFSVYNPALRYSEGVISQNYLASKMTVELPNQ